MYDLLPGERETIRVAAGNSYYYTRQYIDPSTAIRLEHRRRLILRKIFSHISVSNLQTLETLQEHLQKRSMGNNYVAIHIRTLDGQCARRVGPKLPKDECKMDPSYIKALLRPHYEDLSQVPIVIISDMQSPAIPERLKADPEIGPNVIVPVWDFPANFKSWKSRVQDDMAVAINSKFFIGPRGSSMTVMIGLARVALGADLLSNLIYVEAKKSPVEEAQESYEICEKCIFHCNKTISDICGEYPIYA
jgi:hypothetical protein